LDWLEDGIYPALLRRGISRRSFIKFSAAMAATLALPPSYGARIATAVETAPRIPLIWLRGQSCGGDGQAFLQASDPTVAQMLIELLSVDYSDALMAPSGAAAERSRSAALEVLPARYIAVVEGSIPTAADGTACLVGGRAFSDVAREVCAGAVGTIAVGSCAFDGGVSAARGSTTSASGVGGFVPAGRLINLPGCPVNGDNLAATLVHYLTFKEMPATDMRGRPLFAYSGLIHNQCERRAHFEFGEFVLAWGDEAAQKGWCLYKMGCKGPESFANCPTVRYAAGTSWNVQAGHGCIGCTMPGFWDAMGPAYARLPAPIPFVPDVTSDQIGQVLVAGVAGLAVVHGGASWVRGKRNEAHRRAAIAAAGAGESATVVEAAAVQASPEALAVEAPAAEPEAGDAPPPPDESSVVPS
jgi:hydrogenase small subunit